MSKRNLNKIIDLYVKRYLGRKIRWDGGGLKSDKIGIKIAILRYDMGLI
jgi:hypothetical protein